MTDDNSDPPTPAPNPHAQPPQAGGHGRPPRHSERGDRRPRQNGDGREGGAGRGPESRGPTGGRGPLREENTIFIGKKSTMSYVLAAVSQFQAGAPEVKLKARGNIISQAVDVAEIVRSGRFIPDIKLGPVSIRTEELENEDGSRSRVSAIEIVLLR